MKDNIVGNIASVSALSSVISSWQVCHNLCLALVSILSLIGITLIGMPLLFLTKFALPMWLVAVLLLLFTLYMHMKKRCISGKQLLFNTGLIVAVNPLHQSFLVWAGGTLLIITAAGIFLREKVKK